MLKKTIYKRILHVEVLSEEPIKDDATLNNIIEGIDGDSGEKMSGHVKWGTENIRLQGKRAVNNCERHGTDIEFFNMDVNGNEVEFEEHYL